MSFDRLGRFVVRRRWWIVAAWAVILLAALPFAPQAPGALSAGGFILDDLESARAKQLLQDELGVEPSAFVLVYTSDTLTAGHARVARRRGRGHPRRRRRSARDTDPVPRPLAAPGERRRPHGLRHRVPRHPARRLAGRDPAGRGRPPRGPGPDRPHRRRPGVLRRRPGGHRAGPPPQRARLAAAGGAGAAARVREPGRGGRAAGGRRRLGAGGAGRDLRRRVGHPDEHLRAQPRDAAGPRAGRGLLAADDQPVPRGAGPPRRAGPGRRGGPGHGRDGRPRGVLLGPDGPARPARASCCSSS